METKTVHPIFPEGNKEQKKPHHENVEQVTNFTGNIKEWVYNKDYIYDGFIFQSENENLLVKFPPHLGKLIKTATENNPEILLKGVLQSTPEGKKNIRFISMQSTKQLVNDIPPVQQSASDLFTKGEGKISDFQYDNKKNICGYIIDNQYVLKIPPHIYDELKSLAIPGSLVKFTGIKKTENEGEIKVNDYTLLHTKTLSVNDIEYSIK